MHSMRRDPYPIWDAAPGTDNQRQLFLPLSLYVQLTDFRHEDDVYFDGFRLCYSGAHIHV